MDNSNKSKTRKSVIIYFTQVILIYTVVVACIINLSIGQDNPALWSSLLSGALGYILPAPGTSIRRKKEGGVNSLPIPLDFVDNSKVATKNVNS